jgi:pyridinium-3,5-biscarboxylic acid mononucleotide sulfurtransferase
VLEGKMNRLREELSKAAPFLVAVSGGIDSRFLLHTALGIGVRCEALIFTGPHQSPAEREKSLAWLKRSGATVHRMEFNPLEGTQGDEPRSRCYRCKQRMFLLARSKGSERGLTHVLDGTQADDLSAHRPGIRALEEHGVLSPLAMVGLGKEEIRTLARRFGLERSEQPSRPCLLTRFPYGHAPSPQELISVGRAEDGLSALGLTAFRIRCLPGGRYVLHLSRDHKEHFARIKDAVACRLAEEGFTHLPAVFLEHVSGYFDQPSEVLHS